MDTTGCNVSVPHAEFHGKATDEAFVFGPPRGVHQREPYTEGESDAREATLTNVRGGTVMWLTTWDLNCKTFS